MYELYPCRNGNPSYHNNANHGYRLPCNHSYTMESLAQRITRLRTQRDLSMREVGIACRVSHVAVGKWENGQTENIKLANLLSLARLFGVTVGELLQERPPKGAPAVVLETREPGSDYRALSDDELLMLEAFRMADPLGKQMLLVQAGAIRDAHTRAATSNAA